jgi:hypothetical protein
LDTGYSIITLTHHHIKKYYACIQYYEALGKEANGVKEWRSPIFCFLALIMIEIFENLKAQLGHENLQIDIIPPNSDDPEDEIPAYVWVRVKHIPTGRMAIGKCGSTQLENTVEAMEYLAKKLL